MPIPTDDWEIPRHRRRWDQVSERISDPGRCPFVALLEAGSFCKILDDYLGTPFCGSPRFAVCPYYLEYRGWQAVRAEEAEDEANL